MPFFRPKLAKIRGFFKIFGRKNIFSKKTFVPSSSTFYCGSFELSYSCVPLTFAEIFPSEQIGPTLFSLFLLLHQELMSLAWPDKRTGIGARVWSGLSVLRDDWWYDSHFFKKWLCTQRRGIMGKNFEIEIILLK